jgi:hypothetical protein
VSPCKCSNFWFDELKNVEMVSRFPSCCCMPLTRPSRFKFIKIPPPLPLA